MLIIGDVMTTNCEILNHLLLQGMPFQPPEASATPDALVLLWLQN